MFEYLWTCKISTGWFRVICWPRSSRCPPPSAHPSSQHHASGLRGYQAWMLPPATPSQTAADKLAVQVFINITHFYLFQSRKKMFISACHSTSSCLPHFSSGPPTPRSLFGLVPSGSNQSGFQQCLSALTCLPSS